MTKLAIAMIMTVFSLTNSMIPDIYQSPIFSTVTEGDYFHLVQQPRIRIQVPSLYEIRPAFNSKEKSRGIEKMYGVFVYEKGITACNKKNVKYDNKYVFDLETCSRTLLDKSIHYRATLICEVIEKRPELSLTYYTANEAVNMNNLHYGFNIQEEYFYFANVSICKIVDVID